MISALKLRPQVSVSRRVAPTTQAAVREPLSEDPEAPIRVLLVEQDVADASRLRGLLKTARPEGLHITEIRDLESALTRLRIFGICRAKPARPSNFITDFIVVQSSW